MTQTYWIDGNLWLQWTPEQRGEYVEHLEAKGIKWGISWIKSDHRQGQDWQKDLDEYREEMSLGGSNYDPMRLGVQSSIGKKQ